MKNNLRLIQYFHCAIVGNSKQVDPVDVNRFAMERGYMVDECVCNADVLDFLRHESTNYNATFWKDWDDVLSRSQLELYLFQALHYLTTYGTNYTAEAFVPNDMEGDVPDIKNFKYISCVTEEELYDKCMDILASGIALGKDTMMALCEYVRDYCKEHKATIDIDAIKNKEAKCYLSSWLGIMPSDPVELLRMMVFSYIKETLLIKSDETIKRIKIMIAHFKKYPKLNTITFSLNDASDETLRSLATIFYRFKPIFLAFRGEERHRAAINKIRRYAKTLHQPMKQGFWQTVLTEEKKVEDIKANLGKITVFKKLALMQACLEHVLTIGGEEAYKAYIIRNSKLYVKPRKRNKDVRPEYYSLVYTILRESVIETMKKNTVDGCAYKLPDNVVLAVPTSDKNFIGNYPIGSYINAECGGATTIGIYWRGEWGTQDFDLSLFDIQGNRYGWCYSHKSKEEMPNVIYSGDMTRAEPEATELMYCEDGMPDSVMRVNRYNGQPGSRYKLFIAKSKIEGAQNDQFKGYMCDPNDVIAEAECISDSAENTVGIYTHNAFYFTNLVTGSGIVAKTEPDAMLNAIYNRLRSAIQLKNLLDSCGMHEAEGDEEVVLDLSDVTKDKVLGLFLDKKEDK